jgi:hypothetical protein
LGLGQVAVGHGASFRLAGQKVIILCFLTLLFLGCCTSYLKPPFFQNVLVINQNRNNQIHQNTSAPRKFADPIRRFTPFTCTAAVA